MAKDNPKSSSAALERAREYHSRPDVKERRHLRDIARRDKRNEYQRKWCREHPVKVTPELRAYQAKWQREHRAKDPEANREYNRKYEAEHREERNRKHREYGSTPEAKARKAQWHKENPPPPDRVARNQQWRKESGWDAKHYRENIETRIKYRLRGRLYKLIKSRVDRRSPVKFLGCSVAELIVHVQSKFLPGMTWENWSQFGWHLDHVRPLASFCLTEPAQFAEACHYTNLQPLWWADNIRKGKKICDTC